MSIILIVCGVSACSSPPPAHVVDRDQPPSRKIVTHRVSAGETLYSIAWRYNLDYRELARHNGIGKNFKIYTNQVLRLDVNNANSRVQAPPEAIAARPVNRSNGASDNRDNSPSASVSRPSSRETSPQIGRQENRTASPPPAIADPVASGPVQWRWPAAGPLIGRFGDQTGLNKGIDIGGKLGQPVVAASAGNVVYAGTGLRGYGNLVIIKHSETFLSAYAHNHKLMVKEGQAVKAGQQIAELGSSGTDREKLHFEIRRDGKPVDPLQYLPKR